MGGAVPRAVWSPDGVLGNDSAIDERADGACRVIHIPLFSIAQLRDCLAYYSHKIHPSSRTSVGAADHWEVQRSLERLPMYLLEEPKRVKVVKALERALRVAESGGVFAG